MKSFTELCLEDTYVGAVAAYMDDMIGEEELVTMFGNNPVVYGLIAMNQSLNLDYDYENLYANLIHHKPTVQEDFDNLLIQLFSK